MKFFLYSIGILVTFFIALFVLYPSSSILLNTFFSDHYLSFTTLRSALTNVRFQHSFLNSVSIASWTTILSICIGLPIAILFSRFHFPFRSLLSSLLIVPLIIPPFVGAIGIRQIFGRFGSVNLVLMNSYIISEPIDWLGSNSVSGIVLVQTLHSFPLVFIYITAAIERLDFRLFEASSLVSRSSFSRLINIQLPLLSPAILASGLLLFLGSFTDLGTPVFFGLRACLPVQIFDHINDIAENPIGYGYVFVTCLFSISIVGLGKLISPNIYLDKGQQGTSSKIKRIEASSTTGLIITFFVSLLLFISLLPHMGIFLIALSKRWFFTVLPSSFTFESFIKVFYHPLTIGSLLNSLLLSIGSTFIVTSLGFLTAYLASRLPNIFTKLLLNLGMLPLVIPGIVLAFGFLGAFSGTLLDPRVNAFPLLMIAYAARRLPYILRSSMVALEQFSFSLEEAAIISGSHPFRTLRTITLPLVLPNLLAGALVCFAFSMIEVSDSLILALDEKNYPISKALYALAGRPDGIPLACALGVVSSLFVLFTLVAAAKLTGRNLGDLFRG